MGGARVPTPCPLTRLLFAIPFELEVTHLRLPSWSRFDVLRCTFACGDAMEDSSDDWVTFVAGRPAFQAAFACLSSSAERLPSRFQGSYPGMMVQMSPAATKLVGCRALFAFPPSHMAGTGQGRCRARSCSGARLAVIILHFPPHPRPPLRSRAHDCLCTPRPLGRCCAPTPARTKVPPAATDI